MEPGERFTHNGLVVTIWREEEPGIGDPRDADNLGVLYLASRDWLGDGPYERIPELADVARVAAAFDDRRSDPDRVARWLRMYLGASVVIPLRIVNGPYCVEIRECYDSHNLAGFIFDSARTRALTGAPLETVERQLYDEVREYNAYLRGDVYGYTVEREQTCNLGHVHREVMDSCGGFLVVDERDAQYVRDEARAAADAAVAA